jgi:hypothetical protein
MHPGVHLGHMFGGGIEMMSTERKSNDNLEISHCSSKYCANARAT